MKVALLAFSVRGAMGQYVEALTEALGRHIRVVLFVPSHFEGDVGHGEVEVHKFVTGSTKWRALIRFLNRRGASRLWESIRVQCPDVLHLFNGEGYPWGLLIARWANQEGLPLVVTVHDPDPHPGNFVEMANTVLRRATLAQATLIHVHSGQLVKAIEKQGVSRDKVRIIPHGSLARRFTRWKREGRKQERLVLFFGRLEWYKGLDVLVRAGIFLKGKIRIAIAGPGKLPSRVRRMILDNSDIFELHNYYLSDREAAELFQRASVCVLPYRQATQSSVPLIAAAFGVPVVATSVGAFVEDVQRVGGILVPPEDPKALALGIVEALQRRPVYPRDLEFDQLAERFITMYKEAVGCS